MKLFILSIAFSITAPIALSQKASGAYMQLVNFDNPYLKAEMYASDLHSFVHKMVRENDVKSVSETRTGRKSVRQNEYRFNRAGRIISAVGENKNVQLSYLNDTLIKSINGTTKNKTYERIWNYNNDELYSYELRKNGKISSRIVSVSNEQGMPLERIYVDGRKGKTHIMKYEYYDNDKLKEQWHYSNGKLKGHWSYACSEEGQEVNSKNETEICTFEEASADGSFIRYRRTVNDGKEQLMKLYFDKDTVWLKTEIFNENDSLITKHQKTEDSYLSESFNEKGKRTRYYKEEYDGQGKTVKSIYCYKGDMSKISETNYSYNEAGLIDEMIISYKGQEQQRIKYAYTYFD